jgi:hypothetical protein
MVILSVVHIAQQVLTMERIIIYLRHSDYFLLITLSSINISCKAEYYNIIRFQSLEKILALLPDGLGEHIIFNTNTKAEERYKYSYWRTSNIMERYFGVWKMIFRCYQLFLHLVDELDDYMIRKPANSEV